MRVCRTEDLDPTWRDLAEAHLVAQAALVDPKTLRILGRRIFEVLDPETADEREGEKLQAEERRARTRTSLSLRDNGDGTHSGTFELPDLHAAMLTKALQALAAPRRVGEARVDPATGRRRSSPEPLGTAFCELLERYPTDRLPAAGGTNATIAVTIAYRHLLDGLGAAVLDDGTPISAAEARRLACEAGIIPMVLGGDRPPRRRPGTTPPRPRGSRRHTATRAAAEKDAAEKDATGHPPGPRPITTGPGPTADPPTSTTAGSTADTTTTSSTTTATSRPPPPRQNPLHPTPVGGAWHALSASQT